MQAAVTGLVAVGIVEGFEVVESSEQGMLAQVARADDRGEPVVLSARPQSNVREVIGGV